VPMNSGRAISSRPTRSHRRTCTGGSRTGRGGQSAAMRPPCTAEETQQVADQDRSSGLSTNVQQMQHRPQQRECWRAGVLLTCRPAPAPGRGPRWTPSRARGRSSQAPWPASAPPRPPGTWPCAAPARWKPPARRCGASCVQRHSIHSAGAAQTRRAGLNQAGRPAARCQHGERAHHGRQLAIVGDPLLVLVHLGLHLVACAHAAASCLAGRSLPQAHSP
jgi:hypothetical protein